MAFSKESWRLLDANFQLVLEEPQNLEARAGMQLGASLAGLAIENSMLGAAHSAANPLTAHYGVVHGGAVGVMLPHVVRFNAREMESDYQDLFRAASSGQAKGSKATAGALADHLDRLREQSQLPGTLAAWNVPRDQLPALAGEASNQWTARFNPRNVSTEDFLTLYQAAY